MSFVSAAPATQPGANQSSLAWEHEVPTPGLLMLIAVAIGESGDEIAALSSTTPTVGGVPATPVPNSLVTREDTGIPYGMRLWYVLDPATTDGVASVEFDPAANMFSPVGVSLLYSDVGGVDGANVETAIVSGNPATSALEVASEVGGMVADIVQFYWHESGREPAPNGDNTGNLHVDADAFGANNSVRVRASSAAGAATVDMNWANAGGFMALMHVAVPLTPASGGTGPISSIKEMPAEHLAVAASTEGLSAEHLALVARAVSVSAEHLGTGVINISAFDSEGVEPQAGETVVIVSHETGAAVTVVTDENGEATHGPVPVGDYDVYVRRSVSPFSLAFTVRVE